MSKKSGGLFTLLTGVAMGAAAVFFSDKANREQAKKVVTKVKSRAKQVQSEYHKNPTAFKKKVKQQGRRLAKKALSSAQKAI